MADISLEAVTGKLNRVGYDTFLQALRQAKGRATAMSSWRIGSCRFCRARRTT